MNKSTNNAIISAVDESKAVEDVHYVGKINKDIYSCVTKNIVTDEVIITDERIRHIKERRGLEFYETHKEYFADIIFNPDYIFEDKTSKNTAIATKTFTDKQTSVNLVIRLVVKSDNPNYKNSILTAIKENNDRFKQRLRNNTPLYSKKLDKPE